LIFHAAVQLAGRRLDLLGDGIYVSAVVKS
jgi:hypothetical protein